MRVKSLGHIQPLTERSLFPKPEDSESNLDRFMTQPDESARKNKKVVSFDPMTMKVAASLQKRLTNE